MTGFWIDFILEMKRIRLLDLYFLHYQIVIGINANIGSNGKLSQSISLRQLPITKAIRNSVKGLKYHLILATVAYTYLFFQSEFR